MIKSILELFGIRSAVVPVISNINDLLDSRGVNLARDYMIPINNLHVFHSELEKTGGNFEIDVADYVGRDELPELHSALIGSAIAHYELTKRENFRIFVGSKEYDLGLKIDRDLFAIFERLVPIETYSNVADRYVEAADQIYQACRS
ncbi:hypothetical protein HOA92_07305 [archaeon]|jgi:hypothetical protein|nr:hypothetical protein [archaeon]MBT6762820.1 hypothetical protein [archaeon]